jgi:hypothetical protein
MSTKGEILRELGQLLIGMPPRPGIDWNVTIEVARQHGLLPLLRYRLGPFQEQVPAAAWKAMQHGYYASVARGLLLSHQLEKVLAALDAAHVPVVLLKGAALSKAVYPDPAMRSMGDLDLWVPRERLDDARQAMTDLGYAARSKGQRPSGLQDAFLGETQMVSQNLGLELVELHWNVFAGEWLRHTARIEEAGIWERTVALDGTGARQLSPEDAVLYTCLHFAVNHQLTGLGLMPLLDLELMEKTWTIDWDLVVRRAHDWQIATATWLILDLWTWLFGRQDARIWYRALRPRPFRQRILWSISFRALVENCPLRKGLARRLFLLLLVDRPVDAFLLVRQAFFPGPEWLRLLYGLDNAPAWRIWLQQLWHPVRVLIRRDM